MKPFSDMSMIELGILVALVVVAGVVWLAKSRKK